MPLRVALVLLLVCLGGSFVTARADFVILKSGGEIRGEFLSDLKTIDQAPQVSIRTLSGARVTVVREEVESLIRRRPIAEEYETQRRAAPDTVDGNWEVAKWCREKSLTNERAVHLRRVIEFDPEHVAAHRALGHVHDRGRWVTRDEMLAARGYVKHKGKHVLPQELERTHQKERFTEAERTWFKRVKLWQGWLLSERTEQQSAARTRLTGIRESEAIAALVSSFRDAPDEEHRLLLVKVLSLIEDNRALRPLVAQSVIDESHKVRDAAINAVRRKDVTKAIPIYLRALKDGANSIVNRAGTALGQLGDERVIPSLIESLITRHEYSALVRDENAQTFTDDDAKGVIAILAPSGAVKGEFRQSPAPLPNSESAIGDDDEFVKVDIARDDENPGVLAALNLLTDRNFGYDAQAWREWYNSGKNFGGKKTR